MIEREPHLPVLMGFRQGLATPDPEGMRRRQLFGAGENGAWLGHVTQSKILLDRAGIDLSPQLRMGEQRFEFGAEEKLSIGQQGIE